MIRSREEIEERAKHSGTLAEQYRPNWQLLRLLLEVALDIREAVTKAEQEKKQR